MPDDYAVQVSLSLPPSAQYAKGDMINFRGGSSEEVASLLEDAIQNGLLTKAIEASKVYLVESGLTAPADQFNSPAASAPPFAQGTPAPAAAPAQTTPAPMCQHGKRTWKTGSGAKGSWYAWFCPAPKGAPDQCAAVWADAQGNPRD